MAIPLMEGLAARKRLLADKPYEADKLRSRFETRRIKAVIPSMASRAKSCPTDRTACKRRNVIERLFCHLKNRRRIAARHDRLAENYLAAVALVSIVLA